MNNPGEGNLEEMPAVWLAQYPRRMDILPPKISINDVLLHKYFSNPHWKVVVGLLPCDDEAVYLTQSAKEPPHSLVWTLPQETAEDSIDHQFGDTVYRGLAEELGVSAKDMVIFPTELARLENDIPLNRTAGVPTVKAIIYFGIRVRQGVRFRPNHREVRRVARMTGDDYLEHGLCALRPHKCAAMTQAIVSAIENKLIDGRKWTVFEEMLTKKVAH